MVFNDNSLELDTGIYVLIINVWHKYIHIYVCTLIYMRVYV